ncbi:MAG: hypothetical protein H6735_28360 [Alphaproteobacteria bacterium]|nr:hypothetical protein [Alphaproteobacteria bacterium]
MIATTFLGLVACQEYDIVGPDVPQAVTNPVDLDNPVQEDTILQVTTPVVDVLWVVDNSSSMEDNQRKLTENFPSFMDYFLGSGLDYHIGVVSTDMYRPAQSGKLREYNGALWIDPDTDDAIDAFTSMGRVGIDGSGNERGRDATYTALELERELFNAGFARDDETGSIHITIISDENDHSRDDVVARDEFIAWLNALKPEDEQVSFNSICNPPGSSPIDGLVNTPGTDYIAVTQEVGGILHDIREDDWVRVLEQLGVQASGLRREYFLSALPVEDTIEVLVETPTHTMLPFQMGRDYTYDDARNSIAFRTYIPEPLAQVHISYTLLSEMVDIEEIQN